MRVGNFFKLIDVLRAAEHTNNNRGTGIDAGLQIENRVADSQDTPHVSHARGCHRMKNHTRRVEMSTLRTHEIQLRSIYFKVFIMKLFF